MLHIDCDFYATLRLFLLRLSKHGPPAIDANSTQASYLVAGEYNRPSSLLTARPGLLWLKLRCQKHQLLVY